MDKIYSELITIITRKPPIQHQGGARWCQAEYSTLCRSAAENEQQTTDWETTFTQFKTISHLNPEIVKNV